MVDGREWVVELVDVVVTSRSVSGRCRKCCRRSMVVVVVLLLLVVLPALRSVDPHASLD